MSLEEFIMQLMNKAEELLEMGLLLDTRYFKGG